MADAQAGRSLTLPEEQEVLDATVEGLTYLLEATREERRAREAEFRRTQDAVAWRLAAYRRERIADLEHVVVWRRRPYYARMDVQAEGREEVERYYLSEVLDDWTDLSQAGGAQMIHWTVPMARSFAEQPAEITVGAFRGRTLLRRRFEIEDLRIVDMGDALSAYASGGALAGDPFLSRVLAMAGEKARNIVRTIGRQQSEAIFERVPLLVVHGVPGSGKTQIGQMRVAYLVTDAALDPSRRLKAESCLILSPSRALVDYMEAVLPSFGVRGVQQESIDHWLAVYAGVEAPTAPSPWERAQMAFGEAQERYLARRVREGLEALGQSPPVAGDGWQITSAEIQAAALAATQDAYDALRRALRERLGRPAKERVLRELSIGWDQSDQNRYRAVEADIDRAATALVERHLPSLTAREAHLGLLAAQGQPQRIGVADLPALAYWRYLLDGQRLRGLHHVVVDEGQNVAPLAYHVLRRVVPEATFTVLGDLAQRDPQLTGLDDWHDLAALGFADPEVRYLGINYRSAPAIVHLLNVLGPRTGLPFRPIEAVERDAPPVVALAVAPALDLPEVAVRLLLALPHSTSAILCADPGRLPGLRRAVEDAAIAEGREPFLGTRTDAAGLEFDLVLVLDADGRTLPDTPAAASDLFVLASRAQNRVILLHQGPLTPLAAGAELRRETLTHLSDADGAVKEPAPAGAPRVRGRRS